MPVEVMTRSAADNDYLHKDFHGALNIAIDYLHTRFGEDAVREYVRRFARSYHAPLTRELASEGLPAMRRYLERIYAAEGGSVRFVPSEDELTVTVNACPAVRHIRESGGQPARMFAETTRALFAAVCEGTPFGFRLLEYDDATGHSVMRFFRRPA